MLAVRAGAARALSLREKFFAPAASPSKAPRVTTPAIQIPSAEQPTMTQPAPREHVQAPTTPAQPAMDIVALRATQTPLQAPAEEPSSTTPLPDEAAAQSPDNTAVQGAPGDAAPVPVRTANLHSAEASVNAGTVPSSSAELADTTAAPSVLVRELASGDDRVVESDEADKALSALMAQLPASADDISAPAQQALKETACAEPAHTKEAKREMQMNVAPATPETTKHGGVADQAAVTPGAEAAQGQEPPATKALSQQAPVQSLLVVPAERPASSAAPVLEEESVADKGDGAVRLLSKAPEGVHADKAGGDSAGLQPMQTVQVVVAGPPQRLKPANPFFELKSFDPELLQAAEQQRSMSTNSNQASDGSQKKQALPDNPFFEIRGPAASPDQLLRRATLYLLSGESLSATAADLGIAPMSRANTEPLCGQGSLTAPAVTASQLEPETTRQPDLTSDALTPATAAVLPARSLLAPVNLAKVAEQASAEGPSVANADISFMDSEPSAQPKPLASTSSEGDASSRQSSHDTSSGKSSDIYLPTWKGSQEPPAEVQSGTNAEALAPPSCKGKEKVDDTAAGSSAPNSGRLPSWLPSTPGQSMETFPKAALLSQGDPEAFCRPVPPCHHSCTQKSVCAFVNAARVLCSMLSSGGLAGVQYAGLLLDAVPSKMRIAAGSMSGPMSSGSSNSWSGSLTNKAFQLAEQLRHGNTPSKITAARRLQRLAASRSQVGIQLCP